MSNVTGKPGKSKFPKDSIIFGPCAILTLTFLFFTFLFRITSLFIIAIHIHVHIYIAICILTFACFGFLIFFRFYLVPDFTFGITLNIGLTSTILSLFLGVTILQEPKNKIFENYRKLLFSPFSKGNKNR